MIFSLQGFLEDYFQKRNLADLDQYAIRIANLYARRRSVESNEAFLKRLHAIRTVFYKRNRGLNRYSVEDQILAALDRKFKSLRSDHAAFFAESDVRKERTRLHKMHRRSIGNILVRFRCAVEARTVDTLWISRTRGILRKRAERIAQGMLTQFLQGVLSNAPGRLFRELPSGIGFVDLVVMLGTVPHLVELKIQKSKFTGPAQLEDYMMKENRKEGWLVVFDARPDSKKTPVPNVIRTRSGVIRVVVVDINPTPPSRRG